MTKITLSLVEGSERYRIIDLTTGSDSYATDKLEAYRWAGFFISLGHPVRLEERDAQGRVVRSSETMNLINNGGQAA